MSDNYYKINDTVYVLNSTLKLILSVSLSSISKDNKLYYFHSEYGFNMKGHNMASIKREASSMLIFKVSGNDNSNDVCLLPQHFSLLHETLINCKKWFDGTLQSFAMKNNKLFVVRCPETAPLKLRDLVGDKCMSFEPVVLCTDSNIYNTGLRITLNSTVTVDVEVEKFFGLLHVLDGFNMYMATSLLLSYVNTCTPGTNKIQFDSVEEKEDKLPPTPGRRFNQKKSYFDN